MGGKPHYSLANGPQLPLHAGQLGLLRVHKGRSTLVMQQSMRAPMRAAPEGFSLSQPPQPQLPHPAPTSLGKHSPSVSPSHWASW